MPNTPTTIVIKRADELDPLPALLPDTILVLANAQGKLFRTLAAAILQVSLTVIKNADFPIPLAAGQVLEYLCLDNNASMDILIGTTPGSNDIRSFINEESITDGQPISLMRYAKNAETIYITGILANTTVKIKIS